ncbi:glycoside hydrolase family 55 protein [Chryseobacterium sp. C-71]|uniref:glycoside hydrolase family 55 protein n=1 Tax=Chryseobacterium sp. C-71 TaxID=2893882 RepID=UPI001E4309A1|nr:glycoside hydrolase family 55 protein [Chryseobacterium sp. C-71]UFH33328.1 glycoside hydrolase family 55 protein [Chryseobacterium sp. C-71]
MNKFFAFLFLLFYSLFVAQVLTKKDKNTSEVINYNKVSIFEDGTPMTKAKADGIIYLEENGEFYKRAYTGSVSIKWFGAKGDGVTDDSNAIQKAVNTLNGFKFSSIFFDAGVYLISKPVIISGTVSMIGEGSKKQIKPGGKEVSTSTIIRWKGLANSRMFTVDNISGTNIQDICFDTYTTNQEEIQIKNVTGITYTTQSGTRYNEIRGCQFSLLSVGVHYYDEAKNKESDFNMDCNYIDKTEFKSCEIGIKVEQSNVYNLLISRCGFYGSYAYTKNHLLILKGHANISDSYLGVLKNEKSIGGKNGVAVEVNNGYSNLYNIYAETHNGPFFVWNSILNGTENCTSNLVSCNVVAHSKTMPYNYMIENKTSKTLNVSGGEYSYWFSQKKGSTGSIVISGTDNVNISPDSEPDRIFFYGNKYGNIPVAGSIANIGKDKNGKPVNGGKLYIVGETAELDLTQIKDNIFKKMMMKWVGNSLFLSVPGHYEGIEFNFEKKILKMPGWKIEQ